MRESVGKTERGQAKHFIVKVTNDTSEPSLKANHEGIYTSFIPITNYNLANLFISSHLFLIKNLLAEEIAPSRPFSSCPLVDAAF